MPYNYQQIELLKINLADTSFRISDGDASTELIASIASIGLLTPPTLLAKIAGYSIICGFAKVHACQQLGIKKILARIIPPDTHLKECVHLAVAEKAYQQDMNPVELARAIQLLEQAYGRTDMLISASQHLRPALNVVMRLLALQSCHKPAPAVVWHAPAQPDSDLVDKPFLQRQGACILSMRCPVA